MATSLAEMSRLSNGGVIEHASMCMQPVDYALSVGGISLIAYALAKRSLPALVGGLAGGALLAYTCCRDRSDDSDKLRQQVIHAPRRYARVNSGDIEENHQRPRDSVDEASMESFPGSDPPACHLSAPAAT